MPGFFLFKQFEFKLLLYICLNYNLFIMENQQEETVFTQQEVDAKKDEMLKFYTESLTYLEAQLKYETTLMTIDEVRFKRAQYQVQYAMMMAPPEEEETDGLENEAVERINPETPLRKLKKQ